MSTEITKKPSYLIHWMKLSNDPLFILLSKLTGALTFSDGSWWMTGGLEELSEIPTSKTIFFDRRSGVVVTGRKLQTAQAGHCIVEVGKSFVSAGGFQKKVTFLILFILLHFLQDPDFI